MTSRPPADHPPVALFDLDGVLTKRDTFATFVLQRFRTRPWRLLLALPALPILAVTRRRPRVHGAINRYLVRVALLGDVVEDVRTDAAELGRQFADTPSWLLRGGIDQALGHLVRGDRVVVVTASERNLARSLLDGIGLAPVELVASDLKQGRFGPLLHPHNYAEEKKRGVRAAGVPEPWDVIYSDSLADEPLFASATRGVLVNPGKSLDKTARRRLPSVEIANWH